MPINIAKNDPNYLGFVDCIDYTRTVIAPRTIDCELGAREQANFATSFLDASAIYGSTDERLHKLRSFYDGSFLTIVCKLSLFKYIILLPKKNNKH